MNRAQRRAIDKQVKKRLTDEQFKELKDEAFELRVKEEVDKFIGNFITVFKPAMRENKISDERADKIIMDVVNKANERFSRGEKGEPRPAEDKYIEGKKIVGIVTKVLKEYQIEDPGVIAESIYKGLMGEEVQQ